jgi:hypothetical protein
MAAIISAMFSSINPIPLAAAAFFSALFSPGSPIFDGFVLPVSMFGHLLFILL